VDLLRRAIENRWLSLATVLALGVVLRFLLLADVPHGIFHDEAWSDVKAEAIASGAAPAQVYFAENNGMDALHVVLIALVFQVTGPLVIGSRLVSSAMGSLSILATYWAAWELFADDRRRHILSLASAFVIATLFWALTISRTGWHSASLTLMVALSLAALFRARRVYRLRWFVAAGLLAGLAQYAYPTARFLPVLIAAVGVIDLWTNRATRRATVLRYAALFAAALIVFAPLGLYFVRNPEWFFVRAQQTVVEPLGEYGRVADSPLVKTLAGFSIYGDTDGLHNINGRPALDPILSVLFIAGLIVCVVKRQPAHWIAFAWLIVFSLPAALTERAPVFRRWTGVLPAEAILVALGAAGVVSWIGDRFRRLGSVAVSIALVASAVWSVTDYFGAYATDPQLFWAFDSGLVQAAQHIGSRPAATIFLTPTDRFYEPIAITLMEAHRAPIQSYNGTACAVFPEVTRRETEWVVIVEKDDRTLPLMQRIFPAGRIVWQIDSPAGPFARAWSVPAGQTARLELPQHARADFGGTVRLIGFEAPSSVSAGDTLSVSLALEDIAPLDRLYKVFVHLRGEGNTVLAQDDHAPCRFSLNEADWRPGDIVLETYAMQIPRDAPPGEYRLAIGLYHLDSGTRLPVLSSDLEHGADDVVLGRVEVR